MLIEDLLAKRHMTKYRFAVRAGIRQTERERAYEFGLPDYLQHDLDAYKAGVKEHSGLLDCLWGETIRQY